MEEQKGMFTNEERDLIKSTFKDNLPLLKAIRKHLLGLDISEREDIMLKKTMKDDVMKVVYKEFLPTLDGDAPLSQVTDLYLAADINNRNPVETVLIFKAREIVINYLNQKLATLSGTKIESEITLKSLITLDEEVDIAFTNMVARNTLIIYIESRLVDLNTLAHQVDLTEEEQEELNKLDSSK